MGVKGRPTVLSSRRNLNIEIIVSLFGKPENPVPESSTISFLHRTVLDLYQWWIIIAIMLISLTLLLLVSASSPVCESLNVTQIELGEGEADLSSVYWHHKVYLLYP